MLKVGDKAPDFALPDNNGKIVKLSNFKGKKVVLYFYPKDMTPGCTVEACGFRDSVASLKKQNTIVIGISADDEKSHKKFIDKNKLNFPLLSDVRNEITKAYGVYGEKKFMGHKYMGISRTTFLIDEKGKIEFIFENVNPLNHNKEVIEKIG